MGPAAVSAAKQARGRCAFCGRSFGLTKLGRMRAHYLRTPGYGQTGRPCPGSGKRPAAAPAGRPVPRPILGVTGPGMVRKLPPRREPEAELSWPPDPPMEAPLAERPAYACCADYPHLCPGCGLVMSHREWDEQRACNECSTGPPRRPL